MLKDESVRIIDFENGCAIVESATENDESFRLEKVAVTHMFNTLRNELDCNGGS